MSVIDLELSPPRVIDKVVVGDGARGLGDQPDRQDGGGACSCAAATRAKSAFFYNKNGSVVALRIDGKKVTKTNEVEVGGLPEGAVFSDDGTLSLRRQLHRQDVSILRVEGDRLVDTGKRFTLPGHPASMRGRTR